MNILKIVKKILKQNHLQFIIKEIEKRTDLQNISNPIQYKQYDTKYLLHFLILFIIKNYIEN